MISMTINYGGVTWRLDYTTDEDGLIIEAIWFPDGVQDGMEWFSEAKVNEFAELAESMLRKGKISGEHFTVCKLEPRRFGPLKGEI